MNEEHSMTKAMEQELLHAFSKNDKLIGLAADLSTSTGMKEVSSQFNNRFFQLGIAEQDMIGTAAGLAHEGYIPIMVSYAAYLVLRPLEQIRNLVSIDNRNMKLIGTHCSVMGYGPADRFYEDLALIGALDNIKILTPCDVIELRECLNVMINQEGGFYMRLPSPSFSTKTFDNKYVFSGYRPHVIKTGGRLCILTYGISAKSVMEAVYEDDDVSVITFPYFNCSEYQYINEILNSYDVILFVEDHKKQGSLYMSVMNYARENGICIKAHFQGVQKIINTTGSYLKFQEAFGIDSVSISKRIREIKNDRHNKFK